MSILELAEREPDALAFDDLTRTRSRGAYVDRAWRVANLLRHELGIEPGRHAAMLVGNRLEFFELALGATLAGVWITPINWHFTPAEVAYVVEDSQARAVFVDPQFHEVAAAARPACPVIGLGEPLDAALAACAPRRHGLDQPAGGVMLYTSGTTGRPKGVRRPQVISIAESLAISEAAGAALYLDGAGPNLVTGPLYHGSPNGLAFMDLNRGASVIIMPQFDAGQMLRLIQERRVCNTHLVPVMMVRALRLPEEQRRAFDPSSLHVVLHGAAPVSVAVKQRMIEWWGPVLVEYWGSSEGGAYCVCRSDEWLAHPGTVGRPLEHYEVFATDDSGARLPPGEVGALYCRHKLSDRVFEYFNQPEKTASAFLAPGVFTNGDVGRVDADGYVYLTDRAADMINSGGVNIYPAEIEAVLIEHPAVADVAVFGVPDPEWGEAVRAAVELAGGWQPSDALLAEILGWARQRMAGYKVPRAIDVVEQLPRTSAGKLYKRKLRDPYWEGRERRI
jgi:long-chain acyl-CoA synthetase